MAKPFYSMEEVCEMLGKTPAQVRELVSEGALREFRDAGKVFFKAEDVNQLSGAPPMAKGDSGEVDLSAVDDAKTTPPKKKGIPSVPPSTGGTSIIGLEPVDEDEEQSGGEDKDTVITASGIGVFDDDELEIEADPMAETQITSGAIDDQTALEGTGSGSGSGLLDLTRESDDTSLGAELLDEIYPGEEEAEAEEEEAEPSKAVKPVAAEEEEAEAETEVEAVVETAETAGTGAVLVPVVTEIADPYEGLFSGFLVAALILLGVAGSVVGGVLQGYLPDHALLLTDNFYIFLAGAGVLLVLSVVIGMFLGRAFGARKN